MSNKKLNLDKVAGGMSLGYSSGDKNTKGIIQATNTKKCPPGLVPSGSGCQTPGII